MNKGTYMSNYETEDYIKIAAMVDESRAIAAKTKVKEWQRKLRTAATYCEHILKERLDTLGVDEILKLKSRVKRKEVLIYTKDEVKLLEARLSGKDKNMMVDADTWVTLLKVVDQYVCRNCIQGCQVKQCEVRKLLHKSMAPVYVSNPADGECEFHWESKCDECGIVLKDLSVLKTVADRMEAIHYQLSDGGKQRSIINVNRDEFDLIYKAITSTYDLSVLDNYSEGRTKNEAV